MNPSHPDLVFSDEVQQARLDGRAIVALESTIISHGMPYPHNVQTAREVEAVVRAEGAVPATLAVMAGKIRVGLSEGELERLGSEHGVVKVSRRDLAYVLSQGLTGATTVSATMIGAHLAGIAVFVTGGIGGVHRGGAASMDISADLQELARTPVAVVCAGAKSILDIGLTLEYLETQGVPVFSVGQAAFPAFFTRDSGHVAAFQLDTAHAQAAFIDAHWRLGLGSGVVVANPVPAAHAMDEALIRSITDQALAQAEREGVHGKAVTPFLLARIQALTGGASLATNIALVKHNATVGARLALALQTLKRGPATRPQ